MLQNPLPGFFLFESKSAPGDRDAGKLVARPLMLGSPFRAVSGEFVRVTVDTEAKDVTVTVSRNLRRKEVEKLRNALSMWLETTPADDDGMYVP